MDGSGWRPERAGGSIAVALTVWALVTALPGLAQESSEPGDAPPPPAESSTSTSEPGPAPSTACEVDCETVDVATEGPGSTPGTPPEAEEPEPAPIDAADPVRGPPTHLAAPTIQDVDAGGYPGTLTPEGGVVTFFIQVAVDPADLPVAIVGVSSDLHGDVTDPANPAIIETGCSVPFDWGPESDLGGWALGWGCEYRASVVGPPGPLAVTLTMSIEGADGSVVEVSDTHVTTISEALGAIHGRLFDEATGTPVSGLTVLAEPEASGEYPRSAAADPEGRFRVEGLEPGTYVLATGNDMVSGPSDYVWEWYDDADERIDAIGVEVVAGQVTTIEWPMSFGGVVEGTVTHRATGEPVPGAYVGARRLPEDLPTNYLSVETDADGRYRLGGLSAGTYTMVVALAGTEEVGTVEVELGQVTTGVDLVVGEAVPPSTPPPATQPTLPNTGVPTRSATTLGWIGPAAIVLGAALVVWADHRRPRRSLAPSVQQPLPPRPEA